MSENEELVDENEVTDPELLESEEEGTGDASEYNEEDFMFEYDPSQFELPEDYEEEDDEEGLMTAGKPDLATHLRRWGLKVETKEGWRHRGRPYTFAPRAVIVHHTASGRTSGNFASENVVTYGYAGLPGPLCQVLLGRDGRVMVISDEHANHAGRGDIGRGINIPRNLGNTYAYGIEAENNGVGEPWGRAQLNAYYRLCAALLDYMDRKDVERVFGHKEWTDRKIDPAGINMNHFRRQVKKAMNHGDSRVTVHLNRLKPGRRNKDVVILKRRLKRRGFFKADNMSNYYGKGTELAVKRFQNSYMRSNSRHLDGVLNRPGLEKLGLRVVDGPKP